MARLLGYAALFLTLSVAKAAERSVILSLENMTCATCPIAVRTAIRRVAGVKDVTVDFDRKIAVVFFDDTRTTVDKLAEASRLAGFPAAPKE